MKSFSLAGLTAICLTLLLAACLPGSIESEQQNNMSKIEIGNRIPTFTLKDQHGKSFSIEDAIGNPLVIYFYPKDDTPGCTKEACSFRDQFEVFQEANARVIGISSDSPESHKAFAQKHRLPFTLLSDEDKSVRKAFGVPGNLFGLIPGRVTYIVDSEGIVRHIFNSQSQSEKHVKESLKVLQELQEV